MVWRLENAHELSGFSLLCAFSQGTCSLDGPAESVKAILDERAGSVEDPLPPLRTPDPYGWPRFLVVYLSIACKGRDGMNPSSTHLPDRCVNDVFIPHAPCGCLSPRAKKRRALLPSLVK